MLFITKHLIHYLEAPPDERAGEGEAGSEAEVEAEVSYEGWIGTLHPENCGAGIGLEPGAIDSRFYAASSKHRELWNTHCHKHWSPSAQPVESRSLSAWSPSSSTLTAAARWKSKAAAKRAAGVASGAAVTAAAAANAATSADAPSKRDNAFAPAMDMLDEAAAKAEAAAREATATTATSGGASVDAGADADAGSGAMGDSTSFEDGALGLTADEGKASAHHGTLRAAGPRAHTWPSSSDPIHQTAPAGKWRAPSVVSLLTATMLMFLALAAALTMRAGSPTEPSYVVSADRTGSQSKRAWHQWWGGGVPNAPATATKPETETTAEVDATAATLAKSAAVKRPSKTQAKARAKARAEAEAEAEAKAVAEVKAKVEAEAKAKAEAETYAKALEAKAEVKARALAAAVEAKAAKAAEKKAQRAAKNMDKTSEQRSAEGADGADSAGGAGGEVMRADAASGLALASYLPDAGSMTGRLVISAALGVAGLGVGVPFVPGLVDNVIVGGLAAAAPFINGSWDWEAVKSSMADVPEVSGRGVY